MASRIRKKIGIALGTLAVVAGGVYAITSIFGEKPYPRIDGNQLTYTNDVRPILASNCFECHGRARRKADIDLETSVELLQQYLRPGDPEESRIYLALLGKGMERMPPEKKLSSREIEVIRAWIEAGAKP